MIINIAKAWRVLDLGIAFKRKGWDSGRPLLGFVVAGCNIGMIALWKG